MALPLESELGEKEDGIIVNLKDVVEPIDWRELRFKIQSYLRFWNFPEDEAFPEVVCSILDSARKLASERPDLFSEKIAIQRGK